MADVSAIDQFLQVKLARTGLESVAANEAAEWLDAEGLLTDYPPRKGRPLRNLLRAKLIVGQRQEMNGRR